MGTSPGFDMSRMSTATKILLGASLLFVVDSFLPWNRACTDLGPLAGGNVCFGANLWVGIGVLTGLIAIALLAVEATKAFAPQVAIPGIVSAGLAGGLVLFTLIKILVHSEALSFGAWIGILLALAVAYGGYMRFQESKVAGPAAGSPPPPGPPAGGGFTG